MGNAVSDRLVGFVAAEEGFSSFWYDDATGKPWGVTTQGTRTIGYGFTGNEWTDKTITRDQAQPLLKKMLSRPYRDPLDAFLSQIGWDVPEQAREAMISFAFNLGANWMNTAKGFETMQGGCRAKDKTVIASAFVLYRNPGSGAEAGLKARRLRERAMWIGGWKADPYSYLPDKQAKVTRELYLLRAKAHGRGRWLDSERTRADSIKGYLEDVIRELKVMEKPELDKENRRQRLALARDAVAGRELSL